MYPHFLGHCSRRREYFFRLNGCCWNTHQLCKKWLAFHHVVGTTFFKTFQFTLLLIGWLKCHLMILFALFSFQQFLFFPLCLFCPPSVSPLLNLCFTIAHWWQIKDWSIYCMQDLVQYTERGCQKLCILFITFKSFDTNFLRCLTASTLIIIISFQMLKPGDCQFRPIQMQKNKTFFCVWCLKLHLELFLYFNNKRAAPVAQWGSAFGW